MKITKYQHACVALEKEGANLLVDPGTLTHDFIMPRHIEAVVVTHEHADHFDEALVKKILKTHPKATLFAHESISGRFTNYNAVGVKTNELYTVGPFTLQFFGGDHAPIAPSLPTPANLGVLVDTFFYYPGDSFVTPGATIPRVLALPASAPWLKISDAMQFLAAVRPAFTFPTHDAILSGEGKTLVDRMLGTVATGQNTIYKRLDGQSIELS